MLIVLAKAKVGADAMPAAKAAIADMVAASVSVAAGGSTNVAVSMAVTYAENNIGQDGGNDGGKQALGIGHIVPLGVGRC